MEWRCRQGDTPTTAEYAAQFPGYVADLDSWLNLARDSAARVAALGTAVPTDGPGLPRTNTGVPVSLPAPLPVCHQIGEYDLLERLGHGGMGEVWQARHRKLDNLVALKRLLPGASDERFLREMQAIGKLDHPNLVKALDAGEHDGSLYLVMELVDGTNLSELVKRDGPLPLAEVTDAARQVAAGLVYLHQHGFVHRDLKPANLIRTPSGTVKILDLGLARRCDAAADGADLTHTGQPLGTPDYMPPEQATDAARVDPRADLYALGGTLFYLLSGSSPFAEYAGGHGKIAAHLTCEPPDVRTLRPEVPPALADLVRRLLAKHPDERPASAAEALATLTPARPRRCGLLIGGAIAAALLLGVLAFSLSGKPPTTSSTPPVTEPTPEPGPSLVDDRLRVLKLEVLHTETVNGGARPRGVLGRDSFDTTLGDRVTVEAKLSQPAYAYLIAFCPDGSESVCYPQEENDAPERTDQPRYPSVRRGVDFGLEEGEGMQVFAVIVSSEALPPYKEWRARCGALPWQKHATPPDVVWWDDGFIAEGKSKHLGNMGGGQRAKDKEVEGQTPLVRLTDALLKAPSVKAVMAVGFRVGRKP